MIELGTQYNGRTDGPKEREQEKAATVWLPHEYSSRRTTHENNVTDNTVKKERKKKTTQDKNSSHKKKVTSLNYRKAVGFDSRRHGFLLMDR